MNKKEIVFEYIYNFGCPQVFAATPNKERITAKIVAKQLRKSFSSITADQADDILGEESDFDYGRQLSAEFLDRVGLSTSAGTQGLLNGIPLAASQMNVDDFEETILTEIMQQTPSIQKAVYKGELTDSDNVLDYLMNMPHIMPRLNQRILSTDEPTFIDLSGSAFDDLENVNSLINLSVRDMTATLLSNVKYFSSRQSLQKVNGNGVHFLTLWVVADLNTELGVELLRNALLYMKSSGGIRVAFIPNAEGKSIGDKNNLNRLVWAATQSLDGLEATSQVLKWLENTKAIDKSKIPSAVKDLLSATELHIKMLRVYCQRVLQLQAGQKAVLSNGHIIGPLGDNEVFTTDDFGLIERFANHQYGDKIRETLQKSSDTSELDVNSDAILRLIAILVPRQQSKSRFSIPAELKDDYTVVKLPPKQTNLPYFDIVAVLDPASKGAQKLAPILILLRTIINCNMRVFMAAVDKHSDMPVKT